MPLLLSESQQVYEALQDPLFRPGLEKFLEEQKATAMAALLSAVRQSVRDTMKEARLAGKVEAYEDFLRQFEQFAREQLQEASQ